MDFFANILSGFQVTFQPVNILYCFVGVLVGTLIGVLPGIGPSGTVSILLPATFAISPVASIILLAGIYYGAAYGGSTTSILVNVPGEAASVVTCLDGYQMARQGRAGPALGIAAFGSFIAGTFSVIALMFLALPLSKFALAFGPPEYSSLIIMGITILAYLAQKSILKALMTASFGFLLSFIGIDMITGRARYTFGIPDLMDGIGIVPLVMGLFGVAEVLQNLDVSEARSTFKTRLGSLLPNRQDWKDSWKPITREVSSVSLSASFLEAVPRSRPLHPTLQKSAVQDIQKGSAMGRLRVWQALNPQIILVLQVEWCPFSVSGSRPVSPQRWSLPP